MAKESSFDVVSTVDMQEVDNAFQQAKKELSQRYDLKGSGAEITLDKQKKTITVAGAIPKLPPVKVFAKPPPSSRASTRKPPAKSIKTSKRKNLR